MPHQPRLLQICNVGQICGGTAACAWTVARSLPAWDHHIAFPGSATPETREIFPDVCLWEQQQINRELVSAVQPDVVLLHNQPAERLRERLPAPTIQYLHSAIRPAAADLTLCCSHWLAQERAEREFSLERFGRALLVRFDQAAARFRTGSVTAPATKGSRASPRAKRSA